MPIDTLNNLKGSSVTVNTDIQPRPKSVTNPTPDPVSAADPGAAPLPQKAVQAASASASVRPQNERGPSSPDPLQQAVERVQEQVQTVRRDLQFNVDEESGKTVIKVMDSQTGETIRQIPSEEMLEISRALSEVVEELSEDGETRLPSVLLDEKV